MITSMSECVAHNDLWPWPVSFRSFNHEFAIELLKYGTSSWVRSTACTVLDEFFPYLARMITSMRGCVVCKNLWPWPISSRSFGHDFAIRLVLYGTSCHVHSTACTVLDEFFPYLVQMITSIWECVACRDLDLYFEGYLAVTLPILWIMYICGTNTTHESTLCHVPFSGQ